MRANLLATTRELLARAGFFLSEDTGVRPLTFDVVARRDDELLLVKVLTNVDGLTEATAQELTLVARFLEAAPVVVGERSSSRPLEDGAVYLRYGVNIVTLETLREYLMDGVEPLVYAAPGGFYVNIDGAKLKSLRESRGVSLGDLAQAAGVSRRAIGMYEEGMGAMVDVAMRLEEFLDESLAMPTSPFRPREAAPEQEPPAAAPDNVPGFEGAILRRMASIGFRVAPTARSPFAGIGKEDEVVLAGIADESPEAARRAAATANLSEVTESFAVFFMERTTTRTAIEGAPIVTREEMKRVEDPEALIRLILERRGRKR
jgi:putative transcriptional regulator